MTSLGHYEYRLPYGSETSLDVLRHLDRPAGRMTISRVVKLRSFASRPAALVFEETLTTPPAAKSKGTSYQNRYWVCALVSHEYWKPDVDQAVLNFAMASKLSIMQALR
eukprot:scaffold345509_cov19-Prasinocladus_malaysianus.AAC.1